MTRDAADRIYRVALIPGDGIGQEVIPAARRVLEAVDVPIQFVGLEAGWGTFEKCGEALPEETLEALGECDGALFGAVSSPSYRVPGYSSPILAMRKALDLYANLRPIVSAPVEGSRSGVDLLIVRENTEGLYVKQEHLEDDGETAIARRVITRSASRRIACIAFRQARRRAKRREKSKSSLVTIVHKANILSVSDGLFLETCKLTARDFADVVVEEQIVDSMVYRLIRTPERYDVIVTPNLYGDILSDAAAALVGGLGLVPSANCGDRFVLAEPVHGSAPDIAGQGVANPVAAVRAGALLLEAMGEGMAASAIERAVGAVLAAKIWTPDLGGNARTEDVVAGIVGEIRRNAARGQ